MAHKVHPKAFRLRRSEDWDSRWINIKNTPRYLEEDFIIRELLNKKLKECGIQSIMIERFRGKANVIINTARPGLIIGRGGQEVEIIKKALEKAILKKGVYKEDEKARKELKIEIREIRNPWIYASLIAQWMAQQIEKRLPHRRVLKQTLEKVMANKEIQGARLEVSGRLDGSEIARDAKLTKGRLPRQMLRADIDYAGAEAHCTYGVIGVKVWLYKGDKFDK
ncbi:MAG: 30S ribosomal protein S3 [Candidatus Parcubacteria bacterium]|nr:30S ribosomal protein S3 [Candidatus Parcubacteria bacterium]